MAAVDALATGLFALERQDAIFCLTGERAIQVMAQTCGINWQEVPDNRLVMTRVAGVSCAVRRQEFGGLPGFLLQLDPTYGSYLWQQLLEICQELGGAEASAGELFPALEKSAAAEV